MLLELLLTNLCIELRVKQMLKKKNQHLLRMPTMLKTSLKKRKESATKKVISKRREPTKKQLNNLLTKMEVQ